MSGKLKNQFSKIRQIQHEKNKQKQTNKQKHWKAPKLKKKQKKQKLIQPAARVS